MKYAILFLSFLILMRCREQVIEASKLPENGTWVNYKYPLYLGEMRSARFVQNQIYISGVQFKPGNCLVWIQFRLRDWYPYNPIFLGNKKWLLHSDSSNIDVGLELMENGNAMIVGNDMFLPVTQGKIESKAFGFYADNYHNGDKAVCLRPNGEIMGLDTFIAFKPVVDYSEEPGTGDRILLQSVSGGWHKFGIRIADLGALEIYKLKKNKLGRKIYFLQREIKPIIID